MIKTVVKYAQSKKGKYTVILWKEDCKINDKIYYTMKQYDYSTQRESYGCGFIEKEAIKKFNIYIENWNKYNKTLGKLYELDDKNENRKHKENEIKHYE